MARRRHGIIPRVAHAVFRGARWCLFHPQPLGALVVILGSVLGLWGLTTRSDAFRITEIRVPADSSLTVPSSLIGQNLWAIDLKAQAVKLKAQQPQLKRIRVIRRLPNALQVEVIERTPVAQVRHGQWHPVDAEGFVFPEASSAPWDHLVILKGVGSPQAPLKVGGENESERLLLALRLVATLRRSPVLIGHRLTAVDVSDPRSLSFVIDDEIEIRCGDEDNLTTALGRLRTVLRRVAGNPLAIRYIDVRFKDPVIGPRT